MSEEPVAPQRGLDPSAPHPPTVLQSPMNIRSTSLAVLALLAVIGFLFLARAVFIPITIAVLASYALAPLVLMSMVLLAHSKTHGLSVAQNVGSYVPLSLTALFALSYALGILMRRTVALHARFMVCTALTLIDPVLVRMMFWVNPNPTWMYQWFTFAVTDLVFVVFIWRERHARVGRAVFPTMLGVFVLAQVILLFGFYQGSWWQAFVRWFVALPLT